ncbi:MAG TPA: outer membrane beta-barrel protein [Polyangiaceae bacterium]|nr:outer membrane beta-barrel protein [Polyangiaceae bacterium]
MRLSWLRVRGGGLSFVAIMAVCPSARAQADGDASPHETRSEPFAFGDFSWLNGANRQHKALLDSEYFTGSVMLDVNYAYSFNRPIDDTVVGSTAISRNNELTLQFLGFGGDLHYGAARGRFMTQFGTRATQIPRNDGSINRGQFDLATALRYVSEAYGGYHWDAWHGINLDIGIFMSYVGLFSYASFENWAYQPSFTSDNTPWFFNGARLQAFPTDTFKAELWLINGWQTYGKFNELPGVGFQVLWRPVESFEILSNGYVGWDTQDDAGRMRFHSDNSLELRYYNAPGSLFHRAAFSITADIGGEQGDGVTPFGGRGKENGCTTATPCEQNFVSGMAYHRMWFWRDRVGWTFGGGVMHNPGRYLVLAPTGAATPGTPITGFDMSAGTKFDAWDASTTLQWMPNEQETWELEFVHREASVPYFAGHGGVTSPDGYVTTSTPSGWRPDLVKAESKLIAALLVRF